MSAKKCRVRASRDSRVLMLVPYPAIQGPLPKIVPLLVDSLRALGCDIETEHWRRHADNASLLRKVAGRAGVLRHIHARLRPRRFDVVFIISAHNGVGLTRDIPLVLAIGRVCRRRLIQFHGSYSDHLNVPGHALLKFASRALVRACDAVLVSSQEERDEWTSFYPKGRFEVVANAFSPELVGSSDAHRTSEPGDARTTGPQYRSGSPTLLYVGRLMPEKGVFDLLQAKAQVVGQVPCRLLVVGDGASAQALVRMAEKFGIAGSVEMLGHVSEPRLARCYAEADALVLPSYREGFPTVLLEAMSAGLPLVTTRLRGAADRLEEGVHVLFVPPWHPATLAEALIRVLTDDELRTSMAVNNVAKVREFAPNVVAPQYLAILESVVDT